MLPLEWCGLDGFFIKSTIRYFKYTVRQLYRLKSGSGPIGIYTMSLPPRLRVESRSGRLGIEFSTTTALQTLSPVVIESAMDVYVAP